MNNAPTHMQFWKKLWETDTYVMFAHICVQRLGPHEYKLTSAYDHALYKKDLVEGVSHDSPDTPQQAIQEGKKSE